MKQIRVSQLGEEIKRVISELLRGKIKDPRISDMTSITEVRLTNDLSFAKIYVSVFGDEKSKEDAIKGLQSAEGFIKREIGKNVKMRIIPKLIFTLDETVEESMKLEELIRKARESEGHFDDVE
ncbi:30S ribosome-binding factor RbfA [Peptoniphilus sp. GNH]|nr:ribosome-binding factor A [Clostridiales bacterium KA00134]UHR02921.1 30S ribosome-binding factor RbfA [Peptoniphilus sp. GNH]